MIDLKKTLKSANLTQVYLADELGESKARVWYWVHKNIPMSAYIRLNKFFGDRAIKIFYLS